jgi:hypothetical protein
LKNEIRPTALAIASLTLALGLALPADASKSSKPAAAKAPAPSAPRSVGMGCLSPPKGWEISKEPHQGWVGGQVRGPAGRFVSFSIGTGAQAVSPARIAEFQWLKSEKLKEGDLHYALQKKADGHFILMATVVRGPLAANFIAPQRDFDSLGELLSIARSYTATCADAAGKK